MERFLALQFLYGEEIVQNVIKQRRLHNTIEKYIKHYRI